MIAFQYGVEGRTFFIAHKLHCEKELRWISRHTQHREISTHTQVLIKFVVMLVGCNVIQSHSLSSKIHVFHKMLSTKFQWYPSRGNENKRLTKIEKNSPHKRKLIVVKFSQLCTSNRIESDWQHKNIGKMLSFDMVSMTNGI